LVPGRGKILKVSIFVEFSKTVATGENTSATRVDVSRLRERQSNRESRKQLKGLEKKYFLHWVPANFDGQNLSPRRQGAKKNGRLFLREYHRGSVRNRNNPDTVASGVRSSLPDREPDASG
jgi:hypothetical protein